MQPVLVIPLVTRVGWIDRLRVLFHGTVHSEVRVFGVEPGDYHVEHGARVPRLFGAPARLTAGE